MIEKVFKEINSADFKKKSKALILSNAKGITGKNFFLYACPAHAKKDFLLDY